MQIIGVYFIRKLEDTFVDELPKLIEGTYNLLEYNFEGRDDKERA